MVSHSDIVHKGIFEQNPSAKSFVALLHLAVQNAYARRHWG